MRAIVLVTLAACHHAGPAPMSSHGGIAAAPVDAQACAEPGYAVTAVNHTSAHGDLCSAFHDSRAALLPLPIVKDAAIRVELVAWTPVDHGAQLACGIRLSSSVGGKLLGVAEQTLTIQVAGNPSGPRDCIEGNIFDLMQNKIVPLLKPLGPTPPPPPPLTITVH